MVLPVPGLPVKTRWRLCSTTGRPLASRSFSTRSRSVTSLTSAFTGARPTRASSSASSSSMGRGAPAGATGTGGAGPVWWTMGDCEASVCGPPGRRTPAPSISRSRAARKRSTADSSAWDGYASSANTVWAMSRAAV